MGGWWRLDEVIEPSHQLMCSRDAYYFRVVRNPVLEVMLLDNNEPTSYGEAMVGPDSDEWLKAIKSERIHV